MLGVCVCVCVSCVIAACWGEMMVMNRLLWPSGGPFCWLPKKKGNKRQQQGSGLFVKI